MNPFKRRAATRIAAVSLVLAAIASPLAWYVEQENAEQRTVSLAMEESRRLLGHFDSVDLRSPESLPHAEQAAQTLVGGLFDIAEIYDGQGRKVAEAMTEQGAGLEKRLSSHGTPAYAEPFYESLRLDSQWVLRVFIPLQAEGGRVISAYFEGVRVVPDWQREQVLDNALVVALLVGLSALLCGAAIYPVVVHLSSENERRALEVLDSHISMMEALGRAIAKRDSDTGAHNYRVAWIASGIGERMGVRGPAMQSLIAGSFLHDVGKIGIPDAILLKPGKLTAEEFEIMRSHVNLGEEIVTGMGWLDGANAVVAAHHEKWNGQGYPRRLQGEAIPLAARIFAVADVFDALCSRRPYKEPMPFEQAMAILETDTGSHFDPAVMAVFRELAPVLHAQLAEGDERHARDLLQQRVRRHFGV